MKTKHLLVPFSYIFHPIFISIYGTILYFFISAKHKLNNQVTYLTFIQIVLLTSLIPLFFYFLLKLFKKVETFTEATLEERKKPLFIQLILLYLLLNYSVLELYFPELYKFFQAGFLSTFLVFIAVQFNFKASLHMIGISSLFAFTIMFTSYNSLFPIKTLMYLGLCMGFVASSRLYMNAHTYKELFVGMLLGLIPQFLVWYI